MKISLQYKLLAAFIALVVLGLAGVGAGGSMLIRDYFIGQKQRELTEKAYEMARMVDAYYDGRITHDQLNNFVSSVDSFLDARVWIVDKDLNFISVSEERPREGQTSRQAPVRRFSPMCSGSWWSGAAEDQGVMMTPGLRRQTQERTGWSRQQTLNAPAGRRPAGPPSWRGPGGPAGGCDPGGPNSAMMGGWQPGSGKNAAGGTTPQAAAGAEHPPLSLEPDKTAQGSAPPGTIASLADIEGMSEIIQAVKANFGKTWAKTYYHPYYQENMLIVAVPLALRDGSIGGTIMLNTPIEEINRFLQHIYRDISYAGLAAILLAVLLAALMARHIVRPLKAMQETAAALAEGNYDRRVQVASRDEVGDLGRSLNSLAHALADYVRRMEITDKMRRDFVANVSHELRTPLTIMRGYNQALQDGTITDPGQVKKYHQVIGEEISRLEKLIADLLDLSQLQANGIALEIEEVSLAEVIDNVITLLKQKSEEKGVALAAQIDPGTPPVQGDGDRLTQLVLILMDNALKFTPAGGQITARLAAGNGNVELTIADTGTGIAPEDLPYIWERFYKADKSRASGGTGLGLAIARQIIELHGATVDVASTVGEGTAFTIRFPITKREVN